MVTTIGLCVRNIGAKVLGADVVICNTRTSRKDVALTLDGEFFSETALALPVPCSAIALLGSSTNLRRIVDRLGFSSNDGP